MEHRPQMRGSRNSNRRGREIRSKARVRGEKNKQSEGYADEKRNWTSEEASEKTISILCNLGNQRFALPPFNDYYSRWLSNVREALSDFESTPSIRVDYQFINEHLQLLSNLERQLEEERRREDLSDDSVKSLFETRTLLDETEKEYLKNKKEVERQKNDKTLRLSNDIDSLRGELARIAQMKTGFFGTISKKTKAQKETESSQRLGLAERDLTATIQSFDNGLDIIRNEYQKRKREALLRMMELQKEIKNQEIDASLETRRTTCDALVNSVKTMAQRNHLGKE